MLAVTKTNDDWKITITLFGNFAGYFVYVNRGQSDDKWPYAKPFPGAVLVRNSGVLESFDPAKLYAIAAQMTLLAETLGLYEEALGWARRANLAKFHLTMHRAMSPYRIAAHVSEGQFLDAIEESWSAYAEGPASQGISEEDLKFIRQTGKVTAVLIAFGLATQRISTTKAKAQELCTGIDNKIRTLAESNLDPFWESTLNANHEIVNGDRNWRTLYEVGVDWENRGETQVGIMYRLASILSAPPQPAFKLMMHSFLKRLIPWIGEAPYQTIVVPFLRSFWIWAFEQYPHYFSAPPRARREVETAMQEPGASGLLKALRQVAISLGLSLNEYKNDLGEVGD